MVKLPTRYISDAVKILLFVAAIVTVVQHFFIEPVVVRDNSMAPKYNKGDIVLIKHIRDKEKIIVRNTIVAIREYKYNPYKTLRKVIGFPRERVIFSDGIVSIHGDKILQYDVPLFGSVVSGVKDVGAIDPNEYFVITNGSAKLPIGIVDDRYIFGVPIIHIWPWWHIN